MNNGFRGFPEKLFNKAVKVTNFAAQKLFGMSRPSEIFYSIKDGAHNDLSIWETVSGRPVTRVPTSIDDVYIKTYVFIGTNTQLSCNNLHVSSSGQIDSGASTFVTEAGVVVSGDVLNCEGVITCPLHTHSTKTYFNRQKNLISNPFQIVRYIKNGEQPIFDMNYGTLGFSASVGGKKYLTGYTTCTSFSNGGGNSYLEIGPYDFTCTGAFTSYGLVSVTGNGNILIVGIAFLNGGTQISGAPTIEFRGGISAWTMMHPTVGVLLPIIDGKRSGTGWGKVKFTTNNQSIVINVSQTILCHAEIEIAAGITVTNTYQTTSSILQMESTGFITGLDAASTFNNQGILYFNNATNFDITTGQLIKTGVNNTIGYIFNGSATLPYTTYQGLYIAGTGIKTQASGANTIGTTLVVMQAARLDSAGNTTVGTTTYIEGTLNLLTHNWTFTGQFTLYNSGSGGGKFNKTGAGNILFIGLMQSIIGGGSAIDMSGNPTIEFRGGINNTLTNNWGTGAASFTTNSQALSNSGNSIFNVLTIVGAITITNNSPSHISCILIDGTVAGSTFINKGIFTFLAGALPMATAGVFDYTSFANTINYNFAGNYTLPYLNYSSLGIYGVGTKTLVGNTTIAAGLQVGQNGAAFDILELDVYNLTVTGVATINGGLSKTGAGSLVFIGQLNVSASVAGGSLKLPGNPTVELRNGAFLNAAPAGFNTGTGIWSFTTNNQTIDMGGAGGRLVCPILISGAITLTTIATAGRIFWFDNTIDGNNAASKLDNRGQNVNYASPTMPMVTGILECNAAANVWKYNGTVGQAVKGGNYRTLELGGSGVKQLQGNVDWITAYSLTGTASVDLNGFTLS